MRKFIFLITFFSLLACKKETEKTEIKKVSNTNLAKELSYDEQIKIMKDTMPKNSVLSNDIQFINDSILKGKFKLDISMYEGQKDYKGGDCYPEIEKKKKVYERYADFGFKDLGDLNGDEKNDSVFILYPLNWCEENHGKSYYFTNNNIPRIESDSFCCELEYLFNIGDIDEDGGNELAEYKTSCTSRYKAVRFWTFKNGKWKEINTFTHMVENGKYDIFKDFDKLYKKTGKSKFKFLEISDVFANGKLVMEWKSVTMK
ncbi:hypothetical protein L1S35_05235 [Flavobacterium sp. AS60]|uniref:hypothetical protein n=1 Tax=Flavobacterium anseongense TaxID=2910677 RepID=UPI001F2F58CB|nr:hypothetical protein [Flavobacterium sp. AS60]MCF6129068.1 hypothetical protein [Flavobacterium sp. AS60]